MKALVIGHTYTAAVNRTKWYEAQALPDLDLKVVIPRRWRHVLGVVLPGLDERDKDLVYPLPTIWDGHETRYLYTRGLADLVRRFQPDILHVEQGDKASCYFEALWFKRLFAPQAKALFLTFVNIDQPRPLRYKLTRRFVERYNLRHSDGAVTVNADAREILRNKGFEKPIRILPQIGVDSSHYRHQPQSALRSQLDLPGLTIGYLGRFVPEKGVLDLVTAFSELFGSSGREDLRLLLVGGGPLRPQIEEAVAEAGIGPYVRIQDPVPDGEVVPYLNCLDILVLPSRTTERWKEQFGHILIEAMSAEVPVVGSSSAEIPRVIGDGGFTFQEGNVQELRVLLERLIASPELRAEYRHRGRKRVLDLYTHRRIAEETVSFWRELAEG